jgi:hypothetical protein
MTGIVNLNRVRKAKAKVAGKAQADANRAAFGRTKADKQAAAAEADRLARTLDGARRDGPPDPDDR